MDAIVDATESTRRCAKAFEVLVWRLSSDRQSFEHNSLAVLILPFPACEIHELGIFHFTVYCLNFK